MKKILILVLLISVSGLGYAQQCPADDRLDTVLGDLKKGIENLESFEADIEYSFSQPLFETETVRTGKIYYKEMEPSSKLRINFFTIQQDDGPVRSYVEQYIFDGVWLTKLDYNIKSAQKRQLVPEDEPVDAFKLASENFPIIGFSDPEDIKIRYEAEIVETTEEYIQLHLIPREDAGNGSDYEYIDLWIDAETNIPARIRALSTEQDVYEIDFSEQQINKELEREIFEFEIPEGFGRVEVIELEQ